MKVECHSSVNIWGVGLPKARPGRGQQSEDPEAPASPSSGLRSRPRERAGQGPGERRPGGTPTPPSGRHTSASRSTNPVRTPLLLALSGVQTPPATSKDTAGRRDCPDTRGVPRLWALIGSKNATAQPRGTPASEPHARHHVPSGTTSRQGSRASSPKPTALCLDCRDTHDVRVEETGAHVPPSTPGTRAAQGREASVGPGGAPER